MKLQSVSNKFSLYFIKKIFNNLIWKEKKECLENKVSSNVCELNPLQIPLNGP
jgi:hypothetical protein